jgi:DUF971 family protein
MSHEPIQFGGGELRIDAEAVGDDVQPIDLDLKRDTSLTVRWADGRVFEYSIGLLRRMSPSAETKQLREEQARNPLTVLPASAQHVGPLVAESAELVGRYAVRIRFSDGHDTGIYTWRYLRSLAGDISDVGDMSD